MAFKLAEAYVQLSQKGLSGVQGAIAGIGSRLKSLLNPISAVTAGLGAIGAGVGVGSMIKLAAETETLAVSFEVLLGSAEAAKKMMEDISRFAAKTPYEQQELGAVAKQLLAFGVSQEQMIPTMQRLGDVASLTGSRLDDVARIYGKVRGQGKLTGETIEMFTDRGIALLPELAKQFGVSEAAIREMASKGQVSFQAVDNAISSLTNKGGLYAGGMERLAGTMGGIWSTFTGNLKTLMGEIGQMIIDAFDLKGVMADMSEFVGSFRENYGQVIRSALETVASYARMAWDAIKSLAGWIQNLWEAHGPLIIRLAKAAAILAGIVTVVAAVTAAVSALGAAIAFLTSPIGIAVAAVAAFAAFFGDAFDGMLATVMEFVRNWDIYLKLAWETWKLWLSNSWERIKTFFVNIGETLVWFASNWKDVFTTAANLVVSVFSNVWHNLKEGWNELWSWISGQDYQPHFKSLLDGFESTIKEFPKLTKAAVRDSTPEIDALNRELIRRQNARANAKTKPKTQAEKAAEQLTGGGAAPATAGAGTGGGGGAAPPAGRGLTGTFGYSALADRMQDAALKAMEKKDGEAARTAKAMESLNQAAQGGGVAVRVVQGGNDRLQPAPAWG